MQVKKIMLYIFPIIVFTIILIRIIQIRFVNHDYYLKLYEKNTIKEITYRDAYRGRILDSKGRVIVDNKKVNIITYRKLNKASKEKEIVLSYKLAKILDLTEEASEDKLKDFYILNNNTDYLLTKEELENIKYRKITDDRVYDLKIKRITEEINKYDIEDRIAINIYYLLNQDYIYDTKIIDYNVSAEVCAKITEENIEGVNCDYAYERVNNYPNMSSLIGKTSLITKENKDYYLNKGYNIKEKVGISGIEKQYEDILHGKRAVYNVLEDNTLEILKEEVPGQDVILSIDLDIQTKLEETIKDNLIKSVKLKFTKYFDTSYAVISDPLSNQILAISGIKIIKDEPFKFIDKTSDIFNNTFAVGSVVKGASQTVGYLYNAIDIGKKINDSCVKLKNVPAKCSFKRLGIIDDITALKTSSNYFQFLTAIRVLGLKYYKNMTLNVTIKDFNRYRDIFKLYGLGSQTHIDYPKENIGITGSKVADDLYLNLAIGQYDTYNILGLLSYINTIANDGNRYELSLTKKENKLLNTIPLDKKLLERIQEGFNQVATTGTGRGYINKKYNPVGKTGTAQTFYNKDIPTLNMTFIGYAPRTSPKYSLVVISPNVSYVTDNNTIAPITRNISRQMTDYLFSK